MDEKETEQLLKSMEDPLAQMHLLLREHGWEPEEAPDPGAGTVDDAVDGWMWTKRGLKLYFVTVRRPQNLPVWFLCRTYKPYELLGRSRSVAALRRRLTELAAKK
jgi:hypothetical protein